MASSPSATPLAEIPWIQAPPGVESNFGPDAPNKAIAILVVSIVMMVITTLVVTLRLTLNYIHAGRKLGWDDVFCIVGFIFVIGYNALQINMRLYARHSWDLPLSWLGESWLKSTYALSIITTPAHLFSKLSILALYLRVFSVHKAMRVSIYAAMIFASCIYLATIPISSYYCTPPLGQPWTIISRSCINAAAISIAQASLNVTLDLYLVLAPIPIVARMNFAPKKKFGILAVFLTGILALGTSLLAMHYRILLYKNRTGDNIWYYFDIIICAGVEAEVALICSSMPCLTSFSTYYSQYIVSFRLGTGHRSNDHGELDLKAKRAYPSMTSPVRDTWHSDLELSSETRLDDDGCHGLGETSSRQKKLSGHLGEKGKETEAHDANILVSRNSMSIETLREPSLG